MKNFIRIFSLILVSVFCIASSSFSQIVVPNYFQIFRNTDKPIRNMIVKNNGKAPCIVNTTVNESVINDEGKETFVASKDLIVAPKSFSLGAGEQKNIRVFIRKSNENMERFFKIIFSPKPISSENDFKQYGDDEKSIGIRLVTGMVASVYVEPNERNIDIQYKRNENNVVFSNHGNYHTRIFEMQVCDTAQKTQSCQKLDDFITLRPKQTREVKLAKDKYLVYKEKQVVKGKIYDKVIEPFK